MLFRTSSKPRLILSITVFTAACGSVIAAPNANKQAPSQPLIYQCKGADNQVLFTDLGCDHQHLVELEHINVIAFHEPKLRQKKAKNSSAETKKRHQTQPLRKAQDHAKKDKERCAKNAAALANLRMKRRKGYRLSESRSLDKLEDTLKKERLEFCL